MEQPYFWAIMFVFFNSLQGTVGTYFYNFLKLDQDPRKMSADPHSTALVKTQDGERVLFDPGNKKSKKNKLSAIGQYW